MRSLMEARPVLEFYHIEAALLLQKCIFTQEKLSNLPSFIVELELLHNPCLKNKTMNSSFYTLLSYCNSLYLILQVYFYASSVRF